MGWNRLLPKRRGAQARLGRPHPALGLPDCDVLCGIHDSNAAYLGYLAGASGPFAVVSTGTWVVCFNSQGRLAQLDPGRDTLANVDASGTPVACSRFMGGREYAAILGLAGSTAMAVPNLDALARVLSRRAMALPSFAETSGPFPGHAGDIVGDIDSAEEAACVATLYLALMTRAALELTGAAPRIFVDGAFVANSLYAPLLATLMPDRDVLVSRRSDGTAIGAAILAHWTDAAPPRVALDAEPVAALAVDLDLYARTWRDRVAHRKEPNA
jgi:sugar (pentulose or hexulose) kinase